jgi:hypothetical protein
MSLYQSHGTAITPSGTLGLPYLSVALVGRT